VSTHVCVNSLQHVIVAEDIRKKAGFTVTFTIFLAFWQLLKDVLPIITSTKEVMFLSDFVCLSVCLFVCLSVC